MTMIAAPLETSEYPLVPAQRCESPTINDVLISALEAYLGAPDLDLVRDTLRDALQAYVDAEQVTR